MRAAAIMNGAISLNVFLSGYVNREGIFLYLLPTTFYWRLKKIANRFLDDTLGSSRCISIDVLVIIVPFN